MGPRRVFRLVRPAVWAAAEHAGRLSAGRVTRTIRCDTATSLASRLRFARRGSILLCIDPKRIGGIVSYESRGVRVHGNLPIDAVEARYEVPIATHGASGLPLRYEPVYRGQIVRDIVETTPSVPRAESVEDTIHRILREFGDDPDVPVIDIAESVGELQSRLTWELTLESLNMRVAEWTVAARGRASSEDRDALDTLAEQNELRLEVHERLKCGPATPGSAAHAAANVLRERGVSLPE